MMTPSARDVVRILCCLLVLVACSPQYNWRQVSDTNRTFTVLLPAKPAEFTRTILLGQTPVTMTMTAAQVEQTQFAIGTFVLPPDLSAQQAMRLIADALRHNINGQPSPPLSLPPVSTGLVTTDITYTGHDQNKPAHLFARLLVHQGRIYQLLIVSAERQIHTEHAEMLTSSFRLNGQ